LLLTAWLLHALTLIEALLGTPPRFGFAPALSMTVWLVLTVYAVERRLFPQLQAHWALAGLGSAAVMLALLFPGTTYHVIASPWLPLHWALGIASYGLFAAAVVHGWLMIRAERAIRQAAQSDAGVPLLTLERLTFRFVEAGFVLLSATLLVGGWFAETLYAGGLGWKWDHKTIFSLLAWATFACLLVGRARLGWRGLKAVRVLYLGAGLLLLSYAGSRFVLEVILRRA
ncbi:MAG: cytochrome c assembly protein, partial [Polaromonas sp.]|nr:cytochrome c assembly protein [Polaromonas sp.]